MLRSSKLIAFAATRDSDRAKAFYEQALGLRLVADEPFAVVFDANGVTLRLQKVQELSPAQHTVLCWAVTDIRETMRALNQRGITFQRYESLPQDREGVWTAPGGAKVAWFKDPDGNTLSLTQF
ncbi:MAG: VOC family protein [Dehalococcoidia bacterium]|nr:VOC family protein [Dehalococcoidia bacterium]